VNALDGPLAAGDLAAVAALPGLFGLRLAKVTSPEQIACAAEGSAPAAGLGLYALLESALAVEHAHAIARAHPALRGVALGEADLQADLGVREDAGLDWCRSRIVAAARAAELPPPSQSVHPDIRDLEGLAPSCAHGRTLGFLGRAAIHPRQLPITERAYLPTAREIEEAETIVKAATTQQGTQALPNGRFIDAAVAATAHRTLSLAHRNER
jgi:citrate lyase subunit beta / citryl-CoA lyase